ncbi:FAD-dependent oxidoreductase [Sneathiella sp. HT1-7]|uniref:FAD-dependent oxidoreductase n=1 Tax=Sneathiella sp. HT1-7 TaxID=2887192 RepID=UPI001D136779|nr:FAD-dependent oxidoreductase [Sneathiella sp. HT1-7]MCC3304898.1 FAD-dependent oxidoreductase [Sneathiella sp. HT1-7]
MSAGKLKICIVGSGPAGMYTAGAIVKKNPESQIDIIDKLATPYGLVRAGVAPDHQTTKNVTRAYDKIMENDNVRFVGNVGLSADIPLEKLREIYDVVVIATGTPKDRNLGIPGEDKEGVFGAQTFVYWYNGHPEYRDAVPNLEIETAVVIGNGNVALDVARILMRTEDEMVTSDLAEHAASEIFRSPLKRVHVVGRRAPENAQFSSKELGEFAELTSAKTYTDKTALPEGFTSEDKKEEKVVNTNLDLLRSFEQIRPGIEGRSIHLDFLASPVEILGDEAITGVRFERNKIVDGKAVGTGETYEIDCQLLVSCIGYEMGILEGLPVEKGIIKNDEGRVADGLYVVGWAKRGPSGTIGTNRIDSQNVVDRMLADFDDGCDPAKPGPAGLDAWCREKDIHTVSFDDWKKIDEAEVARGGGTSPRKKFVRTRDMLSIVKEEG